MFNRFVVKARKGIFDFDQTRYAEEEDTRIDVGMCLVMAEYLFDFFPSEILNEVAELEAVVVAVTADSEWLAASTPLTIG